MESLQLIQRIEMLPNVTIVGEEEFCRLFGYNTTKIDQRIKSGEWLQGIEYLKDGKSRKFDIKRIEEWLRKQNKAA